MERVGLSSSVPTPKLLAIFLVLGCLAQKKLMYHNSFRILPEEVGQAGRQLYYILVMLTRGAALNLVINAGQGEGLEAWRQLTFRYEPRVRSRFSGQLVRFLSWDFGGELITQMESLECELSAYERTSGEEVSDAIKIGVVLRQLPGSPLRQHLVLNAECLRDWKSFREEVLNVRRVQVAIMSNSSPMDVGATGSGKRKDKSKDHKGKGGSSTNPVCWKCGKPGHYAAESRVGTGESKGKGKKGFSHSSQDPQKGRGSSGARFEGNCSYCGKYSHMRRDCRKFLKDKGKSAGALDSSDPSGQRGEPQGSILSSLSIGAVDVTSTQGNPTRVRIGVDSGAGISVWPENLASHVPTHSTPESEAGVTYYGAGSGHSAIKDLGQRKYDLLVDGQHKKMSVHVAQVRKPLLAVSDLNAKGFEVNFPAFNGTPTAKHVDTGEIITMRRSNGIFDFEAVVVNGLEKEGHSKQCSGNERQA